MKAHVKMATRDLVNRIRKIEEHRYYLRKIGRLGVLCCKGTAPIPIKLDADDYRLIEDTEIALSKYGKLEKIPLRTQYGRGRNLLYANQGDRPTNIFSYRYLYLKRREKEPEPVEEVQRLWNERNSVKVSVKDLRNKMKAIPKTTRCSHQHLKDIFYGGVKLAVYSSDSREKCTEAKIALTEYEPMFETSIILTKRGSLCVIGRDRSAIYLGRDDFIYLKKLTI